MNDIERIGFWEERIKITSIYSKETGREFIVVHGSDKVFIKNPDGTSDGIIINLEK